MCFDDWSISKESYDKIIDMLESAIIDELETSKRTIDVNEDGMVSVKEIKRYIKSVIAIMKIFIRGMRK